MTFPPTPLSPLPCDECGTESELHCGICTSALYCSKECQYKAWPLHKLDCKFGEGIATPPPLCRREGEKVMRAMWFPQDAEGPCWQLVRYSENHVGRMQVDLGSILAVTEQEKASLQFDYLAPVWSDITRDIAYQVDLPYTIRVHSREGFLPDNDTEDDGEEEDDYEGSDSEDSEPRANNKRKVSKINKSVRQLTQMPPGYVHDWEGPVVAYGIKNFAADSHPVEGVDLQADDTRHIINFLRHLKPKVEMVSCVRVNSDGDVNREGRPRFEAITIPEHHAIFQQAATQISDRIEFPITVARIPGSIEISIGREEQDSDTFQYPNVNEAVTFLNVCCDPNSEGNLMEGGFSWAWAPLAWDRPVGSCIVARKDKKPLHPDQVAALAEYCQYHLQPFFESSMESMLPEVTEDEDYEDSENAARQLSQSLVLKEITKDKFKEYFVAWKSRQTEEAKKQQTSPYDV